MRFIKSILHWNQYSQAIRLCITALFFVILINSNAQNSMQGDGFGGRLWYKSYNYTVGSYSAYTVCGDSAQLYGWGSNTNGQLGDGTSNSTTNPVKSLGMINVRYYSTGYNMGAIKQDNSGWVWGAGLGSIPKKVLDSAYFLDAGINNVVFVKMNGTVWSVGSNTSGSFGNDTIAPVSSLVPKKMKLINNAVRVANGYVNFIILLENGTCMATGNNNAGGLGNGSSSSTISLKPTAVSVLKGIVDIKANTYTNIALDSLGDVYTWGNGSFGCIGNGTNISAFTPVKVSGLKDIVAISGSSDGYHFMALDANHNCYTWGYNGWGNLGTGSNNQSNVPVLIATDVADIMAGETFSYLVKIDGTLWASGRSASGSIWMNIKDSARKVFTQIDPTIAPLNLCKLSKFAANFFSILSSTCVYDSTHFKAYKNDSFNNYHWDFGDGSSIVYGKSPIHKYAVTGKYKVKMFSTHIYSGKKDTVTLGVNINDASYKKILNGDTSICGKVSFLKVPNYYDDEFHYEWSNGNNGFTAQINDPGTYSLKITDENGCYYSDTFKVTQHPLPKALFKANNYKMCVNDQRSIKFTNLSTSKDSIAKCIWDFTEKSLISSDSVVYYKFKKADVIPVFLSVFTKYGCKNDTLDVFDILPAPKAQFTLKLNDSCLNGNSITLKNNSVNDSLQSPKFKWYFSEGFILSNRNPNAARSYSDSGKYYVDLIYSYANKCIDTLRQDVHIYPHPKAVYNFAQVACSGRAVTFNAASQSDYLPLSASWKFGDKTNGNGTSIAHAYAKKGNYFVTLTSTSPQGCKDSITKNLVVYNPPTANFSINDSVQCLVNNSFQFKSLSKADSGQLSLLNWNFGNGNKDTGSNPAVVVYNQPKFYFISHKVTDAFGCSDSIVKKVEVKNGPTAIFNINDASQCENLQHFAFKYLPVVGNDSIIKMEWRVLGNNYNSNPLNINLLPLGKTNIDLILTTQQGCPGLTTQSVFVNPQPKANFNINNAIQCFDGHQFIFTNTSNIGSGKITLNEWLFGDNTNSNLWAPPNKTYSATGTFKIQLNILSDSTCVDTFRSSVELNPNPIVDMDIVNPVCLTAPSIFKNKSTISSGNIVSYDWDFGDQSSSNLANPMHTYLQALNYDITLKATSDRACSTSATFYQAVVVYPLPIASFIYSVKEGERNDNLFMFKNTSNPSALNTYWDFYKIGKALHDSSISIQDTLSMKTTLMVVDQNGCRDTIVKTILGYGPLRVFFPTAFTPNDNELNETFGPNGVIAFQSFDFGIFNRWGEKIFQSNQYNKGWDGRYQGEICEEGVYTYALKLIDDKGVLKIYRGAFTLLR